MAHDFRPKRHRFFFAYVKKPKICKLQDAQKCQPQAELGIWQDGSSSFHRTIRFWVVHLAKLAGKDIFSTFPPIIVLEISNISEMMIGCATEKVLKMAFPANLASWKAQNLILPWRLDDPSCQIANSAREGLFLSILKIAYFWLFYIGKKNLSCLGLKLCAIAH